MSSRQHIESYLDYYLKQNVITDFAVAISGAWGSGKTTFIKKYLEDKPHVYVSLHGLTSVDQIESEIFAQLHPIRNSKTAKVAKKILAGSLKASLKIDLDGDGESDGRVGVGITPETLERFAEQSDSHVYVFDDIERSQLGENSVEVALGYVNQLTEHLGIKVIALWNDEAITANSKIVAEKTIGQSFTFESQADLALKDFIEELACSQEVKEALGDHVREMLLRFHQSDTNNLRSLRQAVMGCQRLLENLKPSLLKSHDLLEYIIRHAVALKIDQRAGRFERDDLRRDVVSYFLAAADEDVDDKKDEAWETGYRSRYDLSLHNMTLSRETWENLIFDGYVDAEQLNKEIAPFEQASEPHKAWRELWAFEELAQDNFEETTKAFISAFEADSHMWPVSDFSQSVGVLLELAKHQLIDMTIGQVQSCAVLSIARMSLEDVQERIHVPSCVDFERFVDSEHSLGFDNSSEGLAVRGRESEEYRQVRLKLYQKQYEAGKHQEKEVGKRLLDDISKDTRAFLNRLMAVVAPEGWWYDSAVLQHVDPRELIQALEDNNQKRVIFDFGRQLGERYKRGPDVLTDELDWLRKFKDEVDDYGKASQKKLLAFQLSVLSERMLTTALKTLEERKETLKQDLNPRSG